MVSMILLRAVSRDVSNSCPQDSTHVFLLPSDFPVQRHGLERKRDSTPYLDVSHGF